MSNYPIGLSRMMGDQDQIVVSIWLGVHSSNDKETHFTNSFIIAMFPSYLGVSNFEPRDGEHVVLSYAHYDISEKIPACPEVK